MSRDLNLLNPYVKSLAEKLIVACTNEGIEIIVTDTLRTFEEQDRLYALGRTTNGGIVTNAKGGQSIHNYGYAFDIAVKVNGYISWDAKYYYPVGKIGKSIGLEWGGDFKSIKDYPHFQYTQGISTQDFQKGVRPNILTITGMKHENEIIERVDNMSILEVQKLCNKLGVTDYEGKQLVEDNKNGKRTESARIKLKELLNYVLK